MELSAETKKQIDEAVQKAKADLEAEYAKAKSGLEAWVEAHPIIAFRLGVVGGAIAGGAMVYATLRVLTAFIR